MTAPAPERRCGTCKWWERDMGPLNQLLGSKWGDCEWIKANLPASIRVGRKMEENQGTDCAMHDGGPGDDE